MLGGLVNEAAVEVARFGRYTYDRIGCVISVDIIHMHIDLSLKLVWFT